MPNEQSDQTKAFSKQRVGGTAWILLAASRKMLDERNQLRDGLLSKKEPGPDGFENSQPLQMADDAENKKLFPSKD